MTRVHTPLVICVLLFFGRVCVYLPAVHPTPLYYRTPRNRPIG